jgi:pseudouridine-5'-phosphate glycosidase
VLTLSDEVTEALSTGGAVVALESTILAHGLPAPQNREVAARIEAAVRNRGAVPATVAVLDGRVTVGLSPDELDRVCDGADFAKLSVRDLGVASALGRNGATTVASTSAVAAAAGITVFATGGLGGVHRGWDSTLDISADLGVLARTPVVVVCAGVKSILDVPATLEYLETSSVPVLGYRTDAFPGFYLADSGEPVFWRVETPAEVAAVVRAGRELGVERSAVVLANPVPVERQLDRELHDRVLAEGLQLLADEGVHGKDVTPRLLAYFHERTEGRSLKVNVDLVLSNAALAADVAVALAHGAAA